MPPLRGWHPAALRGRPVVDTVIDVTDRSRQLSHLSHQRSGARLPETLPREATKASRFNHCAVCFWFGVKSGPSGVYAVTVRGHHTFH